MCSPVRFFNRNLVEVTITKYRYLVQESPKGTAVRRPTIAGFLRLRSAPSSAVPSPTKKKAPSPDLRRLLGSLDLTSNDRKAVSPGRYSPDQREHTLSEELSECPFTVPPEVGHGFLVS